MKKELVLAKLEQYKDRPIELGLADEGVVIHINIEGNWAFIDGDNLVSIEKNTNDGTYGFAGINQKRMPFKITVINFDTINYVRSYIVDEPGDVAKMIEGFIPAATSKSFDEIKKEIETDSIHKTLSPRGNPNPNNGYGTNYGEFRGSAVSTSIDGAKKDFYY